jgi:hypothetical protein
MLDIFKKKRKRIVISGLAGMLAVMSIATGCSKNVGTGNDGHVRNDVNRAKTDVKGIVTDIGERVRDGADKVKENVKDGAGKVSEKFGEGVSKANSGLANAVR